MASTDRGVLTYHVVPRFDIAAKGGPLAFGIIVADLQRLVPLNRNQFRFEPSKSLKYEPVEQLNFKDTLAKARESNFGAWVKALGLPVGASANAGNSKDVEESVDCESIVTAYFDPDAAYIKKCLAVKPIEDWLAAAKGHTADLYMVTGLKVAKGLKFNKSIDKKANIEAEASAKEPHTNAVEGGVKAKMAGENKQLLEFSVKDIVIGYRVNKYHCSRKLRRKEWTHKDEGVLDGNMQGDEEDDEDSDTEKMETNFEELPIPEETVAREQAAAAGAKECWVGSKA